ncbi:helix-turn-helix domain-containing protein [Soonwooa purpurea]
MIRFVLVFLLLCIGSDIYGQVHNGTYAEIERLYESKKENDESALPYIERLLYLAKRDYDYKRVVYGYEDAIFYTGSVERKLAFADSAVAAALLSHDNDLIAKSYLGKGIVHYFNQRNYKDALSNYLSAGHYLKDSKDLYLQNKLRYHIGVVKSYLGYYDDAAKALEKTASFFSKEMSQAKHQTAYYNFSRGYLNSSHQLLIIYRMRKEWARVDSLFGKVDGLVLRSGHGYAQEKAYLLKEKAIRNYYQKDYTTCIEELKMSYNQLKTFKDVAADALIYLYLAKSYHKKSLADSSVCYAQKVDSIFNQHLYVIPEIRSNYELLIAEAVERGDKKSCKYYTAQLVKADSLIVSDFPQLATAINHHYYPQLANGIHVETHRFFPYYIFAFVIVVGVFVFVFFFVRMRNTKQTVVQAMPLEKEVLVNLSRKYDYSEEVVSTILAGLTSFENSKAFLDPKLNLSRLAKRIKTNNTHLSYVLNEHKKLCFYDYIKQLRIGYITRLLETEPKYLNYTIEALAQECGIANRQTFSKQFYEINGIRPIDFIKKRREVM